MNHVLSGPRTVSQGQASRWARPESLVANSGLCLKESLKAKQSAEPRCGRERAGLGWGTGLLTDPDGEEPGEKPHQRPSSLHLMPDLPRGAPPRKSDPGAQSPAQALQPGMPRGPRLRGIAWGWEKGSRKDSPEEAGKVLEVVQTGSFLPPLSVSEGSVPLQSLQFSTPMTMGTHLGFYHALH